VATALKAELEGLDGTLLLNAKQLEQVKEQEGFLVPGLASTVRVMPQMVPKLGLLDQETIQSVIAAYLWNSLAID
jgi:hypothetical protein